LERIGGLIQFLCHHGIFGKAKLVYKISNAIDRRNGRACNIALEHFAAFQSQDESNTAETDIPRDCPIAAFSSCTS
jgi:hypothetical protein